jgi:hypothetical protein
MKDDVVLGVENCLECILRLNLSACVLEVLVLIIRLMGTYVEPQEAS